MGNEQGPEDRHEGQQDPLEDPEIAEFAARIRKALQSMPPDERRALIEQVFEDIEKINPGGLEKLVPPPERFAEEDKE